MDDFDLSINIDYDVIGDLFWYETNIKEEELLDVLDDYLRSKMGSGGDNSPIEEHDLYTITIYIDLGFDRFTIGSNCGNKGLREGLVMGFMKRIKEKNND